MFDSSPWRRRAEGTASRKCRRSPGPDSAIELPTRATLARGRREKKNEAASCSAFLRFSRALPIVRLGQHCTNVTAISRSRRSPDARRPTGTTRPTVICGSRHAVARWTFATPRVRGAVVHLFPASCATFRLDIFHFQEYNGYFQPPASGRSWGHLRMLPRLEKKVTR